MIAALALLAASTTAYVHTPLWPPHDPKIREFVYEQLPDPGANKLRLCEGRVCLSYHEGRATTLTVTIPFGGRHR